MALEQLETTGRCYYCGQVPEGLAGAYVTTIDGRALVRLCRSVSRDCYARATAALLHADTLAAAEIPACTVVFSVVEEPSFTLCATHPAWGTHPLFTCPSTLAAHVLAARIEPFVQSTAQERLDSLELMRSHISWRRVSHPSPHLDAVEDMLDTLAELSDVLEAAR